MVLNISERFAVTRAIISRPDYAPTRLAKLLFNSPDTEYGEPLMFATFEDIRHAVVSLRRTLRGKHA